MQLRSSQLALENPPTTSTSVVLASAFHLANYPVIESFKNGILTNSTLYFHSISLAQKSNLCYDVLFSGHMFVPSDVISKEMQSYQSFLRNHVKPESKQISDLKTASQVNLSES